MTTTHETIEAEMTSKERRHRGPSKPPPMPAMLTDDSFVRLHQIADVGVPLSTSHINRLVREGSFPKPFLIGRKAVAWKVGDIRAWMKTRQRVA